MPNVTPKVHVPLGEIRFTFARSGGPGGQNVNKVNTKALLRWPVVHSPSLPAPVRERFLAKYRRRITADGELLIASQRYRDASRNVADCLEKLGQMLAAVAAPPKPRTRTKPTRAAVERRLQQKREHAYKKHLRRPTADE